MAQAVKVIMFCAMIMAAFVSSAERAESETSSLEYSGISCRGQSASLGDFGGVVDGNTLNTKAFERAITELRRYASEGGGGGALLYVPAGKRLSGSFSLISHFTLFHRRDALLLASQDMKEWPVKEALPSYGKGRDAAAEATGASSSKQISLGSFSLLRLISLPSF